jgi:putative PIN family toxin of toxin-antitoxin system
VKLPQIVIDTNVVIAARRSQRGASAKLISLIGTGLFEIHISIPLALEYEDVLSRYRTELGLSQDSVVEVVDALCALAVRHEKIHFRWRPYLPDSKDDFLLELAVKARCNYIITYNQKDFVGTEQFGIHVLNPKMFLQKLEVMS